MESITHAAQQLQKIPKTKDTQDNEDVEDVRDETDRKKRRKYGNESVKPNTPCYACNVEVARAMAY